MCDGFDMALKISKCRSLLHTLYLYSLNRVFLAKSIKSFHFKTTTICKPAEKTQIIQPASNIKKQEENKIKHGNVSQRQCENNENADKQRAKPSQEAMKTKIILLEKNLNALNSARDTMPSHAEVDKQIIKLREEIKTANSL